MDDLISRSALIEEIERQIKDTENEPDNDARLLVTMCGQSFIATIKKQPTAYNVDKVVEEMAKLESHYLKCCLVDYNEGAAVGVRECMGIARRGRVNE